MDYIDSQTYASNTLHIIEALEGLASDQTSTTVEVLNIFEGLSNNQVEIVSVLENTTGILRNIISTLLGIMIFLLVYILRHPLDRFLNGALLWILSYWQAVKNWDTDKKLTNIIIPVLVGIFLLVLGFVLGRIS